VKKFLLEPLAGRSVCDI